MRWDTVRAAKKLGVVPATVRDLVNRGVLKDLTPARPGAKRHIVHVDSHEVIEFSKVYRPRLGTARLLKMKDANGHEPIVKVVKVVKKAPEPEIEAPTFGSSPERESVGMPPILQRIEAKLDQLLRMWS